MSEAFSEFLNFFLDEALDALSVWEKACLTLERDQSVEAKEELYRAAHNLKSGSGAVGLTAFNELVHKVEDLISKVLSGQIEGAPAVIRIFLTTQGILADWVDHLKGGQDYHPEARMQEIFAAVAAILDGGAPPAPLAAAETPMAVAETPMAAAQTPVEALSPAELLLQSIGMTISSAVSDAASSSISSSDSASSSVSGSSQAPSSSVFAGEASAGAEAPKSGGTPKAATPSNKSQESIRVAASKLDQLIQLVGELSTQQAIVWHGRQSGQLTSKSCDNAIQLIQKIAKDLQGLALSLRLQPLQSLFQRLERTGRDLARSQEKKIDVVMRGDYVEVDRTVIERIADAMNHVIRNAVDHGIEQPHDRLQQAKTETATLRIEAVQETSGVMITVADDGRGLNTDRILKKARERGIVKPDANLAPQDIHRLIFHAGLSTAEKVTDISGRGVGMDVVKNSVETIGGSIHVTSQPQIGTSFAITLPATLSIIDALVISVDSSRYAIPVQDVAEIINARQSRIEAVAGFGRLLSLREKLIPVETLTDHLPPRPGSHCDLPASEGYQSMRPALIIRGGHESLAFEVDRILGQQPVTVRRLPHLIASIPGYTGGTILGDGDPCVILNLPALVSRHFDRINRSRPQATDLGQDSLDTVQDSGDAIESRYLIFETHGREFGVPLLSIKEILRDMICEEMVGAASHLLGCINVRGLLLAVYDLGVILGLPEGKDEAMTDIVVDDGESSFALRVSRVCAVSAIQALESQIKSRQDDVIPGLFGYLGTGIHEGRTISMLDLQKTVRHWERHSHIDKSSPLDPMPEAS